MMSTFDPAPCVCVCVFARYLNPYLFPTPRCHRIRKRAWVTDDAITPIRRSNRGVSLPPTGPASHRILAAPRSSAIPNARRLPVPCLPSMPPFSILSTQSAFLPQLRLSHRPLAVPGDIDRPVLHRGAQRGDPRRPAVQRQPLPRRHRLLHRMWVGERVRRAHGRRVRHGPGGDAARRVLPRPPRQVCPHLLRRGRPPCRHAVPHGDAAGSHQGRNARQLPPRPRQPGTILH